MNIRNFTDVKSLFFDSKTLKQTVLKNTFWLGVAEIFSKGIGFLIVIWLARHFGPTIYGKFAFALSFVSLFFVFADFGFSTLTMREIARDKSKTSQYIDNILVMKLVFGLITLGIVALIIQFLGKTPEVIKLVYFLGIYIVINTFAIFFQSIFRANEKMQYETACRTLESISLLGLVAFFILNKGSILTMSYAYIGAALIGTFISLGAVWCYFSKFFLKIDFRICKEILKEVWPFALSALIVTIYLQIGIVMLSLMKTDQVVGWYSAGYKLVYAFALIPNLFMISVYPILSRFFQDSISRMKEVYERSLKFIFLISIILFPALFFFSKQIILFFYGSTYLETTSVFKILLWAEFFAFMSCVFMHTLNAMDKQIVYTKVTGISLLANIVLCSILIPRYSYIGLSITIVITEFLAFLLLFLYTKQNIVNLSKLKL